MTIPPEITRGLVQASVDQEAKQILDKMWHELRRAGRPEWRGYNKRFLVNPSVLNVLRALRCDDYPSHLRIQCGQELLFGYPVTLVTNYKPWQLVVEV